MTDGVRLSLDDARALAENALVRCGARAEAARAVAGAVVEAEAEGLPGVGFASVHVYCAGLLEGRIDGAAEPRVERPSPVLFSVDAMGGFAHTGFDRSLDALAGSAHALGVALYAQRNGFTCGALGYFVRALAERGLLALAAANGGPALLAQSETTGPVFCTNPMALAAPRGEGYPFLVDQSSSATAFANLKIAAERCEPIPQGWALDAAGAPTTSPFEAMQGVLLPFGGQRGGNVALIVELLAAGLTGANWSLDAPSFQDGGEPPGVGLFVLAVDPRLVMGPGFEQRLDDYLERLAGDHTAYVPGERRARAAAVAARDGIEVPAALYESITRY